MATMIFYILGFILLAATLMCITRRNPVHAVVYLVAGFFALALMFYLLGAPLVAAWEVIVYAGAIMVLFLFIIMMLGLAPQEVPTWSGLAALAATGPIVGQPDDLYPAAGFAGPGGRPGDR